MNCLLCQSTAIADCLCVPCGAKAWVANARLTNKAEDIGNALAFEHSLIFAKKTKEARVICEQP